MEKIVQYLNNLIEKSLRWFQGLSSIKKLFVCIFGVLLLAISVSLLSNARKNYEIIDYEKVTIDELLNSSQEVNDRLVFLKAEEIIGEIFDIYNEKYEIEDKKVSLNDYYKYVLAVDYKYKISKGEFKKNVKDIVNDFYSEYGTKDIKELKTNSIVDKIYDYQPRNGMYIIKLNINKNSYYVGIKFSTVNNTYNIFYFE